MLLFIGKIHFKASLTDLHLRHKKIAVFITLITQN